MKLVYLSLTGNCKRFALKNTEIFDEIISINEYSNGDFYFVIPTYGFGEIPLEAFKLLKQHKKECKGLIASGNKNWGSNFAVAGDKLSKKYNIPLILKIEQAGNQQDIQTLKEKIIGTNI